MLLTVAISSLCDISLILLGTAGLGQLFSANRTGRRSPAACGAAFLGWYGLRARCARPLRAAACRWIATSAAGSRAARLCWQRRGFSLLNPHAYLDTVVLLGSIGSQQASEARPVFTAGAIAGSVSWFLLLGYGARLLVPLFARPRAWQVLDAAVALMLWGIAASLILSA